MQHTCNMCTTFTQQIYNTIYATTYSHSHKQHIDMYPRSIHQKYNTIKTTTCMQHMDDTYTPLIHHLQHLYNSYTTSIQQHIHNNTYTTICATHVQKQIQNMYNTIYIQQHVYNDMSSTFKIQPRIYNMYTPYTHSTYNT